MPGGGCKRVSVCVCACVREWGVHTVEALLLDLGVLPLGLELGSSRGPHSLGVRGPALGDHPGPSLQHRVHRLQRERERWWGGYKEQYRVSAPQQESPPMSSQAAPTLLIFYMITLKVFGDVWSLLGPPAGGTGL